MKYKIFFLSLVCLTAGCFRDKNDYIYFNKKNREFLKEKFFECYVDSSGVFCGGKLVKYADPYSFEQLGNGYSKDKNFVFYGYTNLKIVNGADPNSIEVFSIDVVKDKNCVFYQYDLSEGIRSVDYVDVSSFRARDSYYIDTNYLYSCTMEILLSRDAVNIDNYFD